METTVSKPENIANYYVLPLLSLNKFSFGPSNFINSYVTDKEEIVVEVESIDKVPQGFDKHSNYLTDLEVEGRTYIFYNLPADLSDIIGKFVAGKFSTFSESAKNLIRRYSGLPYKKPMSGGRQPYTADLLKILDLDDTYRQTLEVKLGVKIEKGAELRDKPSLSNILTF